jgi:type II secretory ATPase GspE/PulE/Tfp pilus assembly ATPase PilB-like protein
MNDTLPPKQIRFFSDQLMLEMGKLLEQHGHVTRSQIEDVNSRRALTGENQDRQLIGEGICEEQHVLEALADVSGMPFRRIADFTIKEDVVARVQPRVALRYNVMPLEMTTSTVTLAIDRVPELTTVDSLRMLMDMALDWVLCTGNDINKTIKHFYGLGAETIDGLVVGAPTGNEIEIQGRDISVESADEGVVKFVNQIIAEAIQMGATDIHIEPFENTLSLRYRVDGICQKIPVPKAVVHLRKAIASCVKIMADLNIAEKRKPHDGRIKVRTGKDEFDLRVSVLPTHYGETVNMRILNRASMFIDLEHLGLTKQQTPAINYLGSLPHGVVLLTGPTGSGKTTTLYALLSRISTAAVKVITVEDPVEYQIDGINQVQVHAEIGLTFANILRSILRHDPDIVLIGEIRDTETADIAVRASLTGHLVFSTLHTNDAPSAVTRLSDMGIEPYLISSCLEGAIAQRLVRRVCASCSEPVTPDDVVLEEIASFYPDRMQDATFMHGRGCPTCNFTGYKGRLALFEIMVLNDELRDLIVHQRPSGEIKAKAMERGLVTLRSDGWNRVLEGVTAVDEVMRVTRKADFSER